VHDQPLPPVQRRKIDVGEHDLARVRFAGHSLDLHQRRHRRRVARGYGVLVDGPLVQRDNGREDQYENDQKRG